MLAPNRPDREKVDLHHLRLETPESLRKATKKKRKRGPPLSAVSARIWELVYQLGGTQEKPCWLKLAEMLEKTTGIEVNRGALKQVAMGECDSNKVRQALGLSRDDRIRIRPECHAIEAQEILRLAEGNPILSDFSQRLKRQLAKVQP